MTNVDKNIDKTDNMLYTVTEVAAILKVNRNFVYNLINAGLMKSIKLGCRKITRKSLLEFLEKYDGLNFDEIMAVKPHNS